MLQLQSTRQDQEIIIIFKCVEKWRDESVYQEYLVGKQFNQWTPVKYKYWQSFETVDLKVVILKAKMFEYLQLSVGYCCILFNIKYVSPLIIAFVKFYINSCTLYGFVSIGKKTRSFFPFTAIYNWQIKISILNLGFNLRVFVNINKQVTSIVCLYFSPTHSDCYIMFMVRIGEWV